MRGKRLGLDIEGAWENIRSSAFPEAAARLDDIIRRQVATELHEQYRERIESLEAQLARRQVPIASPAEIEAFMRKVGRR